MKLRLIVVCLLALCFVASAHSQDFKVSRDSAGFVLEQNGQRVPFDTAFVALQLTERNTEAQKLAKDVQILEELVLLRRRLDMVTEERKTLDKILNAARQCAPH